MPQIICDHCGEANSEFNLSCAHCQNELNLHSSASTGALPQTPEAAPLASGDTLAHFTIRGLLGQGGIGRVYEAHDSGLNRSVALKVFRPDRMAARVGERLLQEARLASALNHPNVVTIYDVNREEGTAYIAMELIDGQSLKDFIGKNGLPAEQALPLVKDIAAGLAHAHEMGIVHGDIKSGNVMVTQQGSAKLLDFGAARHTDTIEEDCQQGLTGTLPYMPPEQWDGTPIGPASDQYSFGVLLYELFTGQRPFQSRDTAQLEQKMRMSLSRPLTSQPEYLQDLLARCLEKKADDRFASMKDVLTILEQEPVTIQSQGSTSTRFFSWFQSAFFAVFVLLGYHGMAMFGWVPQPSWLWEQLPTQMDAYGEIPAKAMEIPRPARFDYDYDYLLGYKNMIVAYRRNDPGPRWKKEFSDVHSIYLLENDKLLVACGEVITEVTPEASSRWAMPSQSHTSHARRLDTGHTLVCDRKPLVYEVDGNDDIVWSYEDGLRTPIDALRMEDGSTVIADTRPFLLRVSQAGELISKIPLEDLAYSLAATPTGGLLVGQRGRIDELDSNGNIIWSYEGATGMSVQLLDNDRIFALDAGEKTAFEINRAGERLWSRHFDIQPTFIRVIPSHWPDTVSPKTNIPFDALLIWMVGDIGELPPKKEDHELFKNHLVLNKTPYVVETMAAHQLKGAYIRASKQGKEPDLLLMRNRLVLTRQESRYGTFTGIFGGDDPPAVFMTIEHQFKPLGRRIDWDRSKEMFWRLKKFNKATKEEVYLLKSSPLHYAARALVRSQWPSGEDPTAGQYPQITQVARKLGNMLHRGDRAGLAALGAGRIQPSLIDLHHRPGNVSLSIQNIWASPHLAFVSVSSSYEADSAMGLNRYLVILVKSQDRWRFAGIGEDYEIVEKMKSINRFQEPADGKQVGRPYLMEPLANTRVSSPKSKAPEATFHWQMDDSLGNRYLLEVKPKDKNDIPTLGKFYGVLPHKDKGHLFAKVIMQKTSGPHAWRVWVIDRGGRHQVSDWGNFYIDPK